MLIFTSRLPSYLKLNFPLQSDRIKNFAEEANIFYDAANKRIATYEEIDISRAKDFYHEILLFNEVRIVLCSYMYVYMYNYMLYSGSQVLFHTYTIYATRSSISYALAGQLVHFSITLSVSSVVATVPPRYKV